MLKRLTAASMSAAAVAVGSAFPMNAAPMLYDSYGIFRYYGNGVTGAPVIVVQGSYDNGVTWTTLRQISGGEFTLGYAEFEVQLAPLMRTNVTTAGTAGSFVIFGTPQPPG